MHWDANATGSNAIITPARRVSVSAGVIAGNALYIGITLIYFGAYQIFFASVDGFQPIPFDVMVVSFFSGVLPITLLGLLVLCAYRVARYERPSRPIALVFVRMWQLLLTRLRLFGAKIGVSY